MLMKKVNNVDFSFQEDAVDICFPFLPARYNQKPEYHI